MEQGERNWTQIYAEHEPVLRKLARELLHDRERVEDAVQETWLRGIQKGLGDISNLGAYLKRTLRNIVWDHWRTRTSQVQPNALTDEALASDKDREEEQKRWISKLLLGEVAMLPELQREVVRKWYYDQLEPIQVAAEMGLNPSTVRTHLKRAREHLRERLEASEAKGRPIWDAMGLLAGTTTIGVASLSAGSLHRSPLVYAVALGAGIVAVSLLPLALLGDREVVGALRVPATEEGEAPDRMTLVAPKVREPLEMWVNPPISKDESAVPVLGSVDPGDDFLSFGSEAEAVRARGCITEGAEPLGTSGWQVVNLRREDCPSEAGHVEVHDGAAHLLMAGGPPPSGAKGSTTGYLGLFREVARTDEFCLRTEVFVHYAGDPSIRPVGHCDLRRDLVFGEDARNSPPGDTSGAGWQALPGQRLAINCGAEFWESSYVLDAGRWHVVELRSTPQGSELRAWPLTASRPSDPVVVGPSLGVARHVLFRGLNYLSYEYAVRNIEFVNLSDN